MLSYLSDFFNSSVTNLNINDIFIIFLFALALILVILSSVIIVSTKVKRMNIEMKKNKDVQEINEKIIQNRLDVILHKLNKNNEVLKCPSEASIIGSKDLEKIKNISIKQAINNEENNVLEKPVPRNIPLLESTSNNTIIPIKENQNNNKSKNIIIKEDDSDKKDFLKPIKINNEKESKNERTLENMPTKTTHYNAYKKNIDFNNAIDHKYQVYSDYDQIIKKYKQSKNSLDTYTNRLQVNHYSSNRKDSQYLPQKNKEIKYPYSYNYSNNNYVNNKDSFFNNNVRKIFPHLENKILKENKYYNQLMEKRDNERILEYKQYYKVNNRTNPISSTQSKALNFDSNNLFNKKETNKYLFNSNNNMTKNPIKDISNIATQQKNNQSYSFKSYEEKNNSKALNFNDRFINS